MTSRSFDPLASDAPLIVYLDHKSPYAYLAVEPTFALADELGIAVDWRPLTLDIPSFLGSARLGAKDEVVESQRTPEQWVGVKHAYRDCRRYARLRGVLLRGTVKIWDSSLAGIGMLWAKAQGEPVLRAYTRGVYQPFWRRELDIAALDEIERVLRESGASVEGFRAWAAGEGRARHEAEQRAVFEAGVFGVPAYVVGGEWYWGRGHLPRVRWLLGGKRGPAPDAAYEGSAAALDVLTGAADAARLEVAIDFKSPLSYLALEPTLALADALGIELDWQPLVVAPLRRHPEPAAGDDRGARHRRNRAEYYRRDQERYAESRGLSLAAADRSSDSTPAALGLLWVRARAPARTRAYVERAFAAHWRESEDLASLAAVARLLEAAGAPTGGFADYLRGAGPAELGAVRERLFAANVFDVPSYRLGDEVFLGRQHLPVIRDLVSACLPPSRVGASR